MIPIEFQEYDNDIKFQLGQRIQKKRLERKLSAVDVAEYLNIQANQISRIENGKANCTIPQMYVLAQLLDCSVDYLLFGKQLQSALNEEQKAAINSMLLAFETS
ncbi:MAG: helix-turn-helix domain-containing protein [Acetatifactor sp.]|nr:helix-turn-helix domain-containing protein [Acetatifactor sp.]